MTMIDPCTKPALHPLPKGVQPNPTQPVSGTLTARIARLKARLAESMLKKQEFMEAREPGG